MFTVLKNLIHSEKAVVAATVLVAASVLFGLGKIDATTWKELVGVVTGAYLVAKGIAGRRVAAPAPAEKQS